MKKLILSLCLGMSSLFAVPSTIDSPVDDIHGKDNWSFSQHKSGLHKIDGGIGSADDTYAWDINWKTGISDKDKPVYAVADGTIYTGSSWSGSTYGQVLINHTDSTGNWSSGYLHMSGVKKSGTVKKGDVIGYISNVGCTDVHLHFAVYNTHGKNSLKSVNVGFRKRTSTSTPTPTTPLKITSIKPVCPTVLNMGDVKSCTATAYYSNGTNKDITSGASWSVMTNSTVLKVSGGKLTVIGAEKDTVARVKITYPNATANGADITIKGLDGQNPKTYQNGLCLKDTKKFTTNIKNGKLHLYYSKTCKTNFGILEPTKSTSKTKVKIVRKGGGTQSYEKVGTIYTPMLFSPSKKVCVYGSVDGATESKGQCR